MVTSIPAGFTAVMLYIFGAGIGSFLNVVALRFLSGEDIIFKPSACPHCHTRLTVLDLIPILSWLFLRGRCRTCQQTISIQYPLVEAFSGLIALQLFSVSSSYSETQAILIFLAASILIVLAVIDAKTFMLPDMFVIALAVVAIATLLIRPAVQDIQQAFLGAATGGGFLLVIWLFTHGEGIGLGDVKLMVPVGAMLGPWAIVVALMLAFTAGAVWGIYLLARRKATAKTAVPFGPFLAVASIICLIYPHLPIWAWQTIVI